MSFAQWLRSNSEYYLLWAAQDRIAKQKGIKASSNRGASRIGFGAEFSRRPISSCQTACVSLRCTRSLEATVAPGQGPLRGDVSKVLRFPIIFFPDGRFPSYSPSKCRVNA